MISQLVQFQDFLETPDTDNPVVITALEMKNGKIKVQSEKVESFDWQHIILHQY